MRGRCKSSTPSGLLIGLKWISYGCRANSDSQEAARLVEQEANQPFDLEKGPLARFLLIEIEPEDHVLVLTMHHIIGDQWSFGVIGHEFAFFYNAFCRGEAPSAKPIPLQYADYAVWQRRCLTDDLAQHTIGLLAEEAGRTFQALVADRLSTACDTNI